MLGTYKKNIISHLTESQLDLLLPELWENIEDKTESDMCVFYDSFNNTVIVKIIDYNNGSFLEEIIIDNFNTDYSFNKIKLSTDSKFLVYINNSNNIVFYDIFLKTISHSKNLDFINIENKFYDKNYFDNNGCRFVKSNGRTTEVFDIQTEENIFTINMGTTYQRFNKDYSRLVFINFNQFYIYDMNEKEIEFVLNDNIFNYAISNSGKYLILDSTHNYRDEFEIWDIETETCLFEYENIGGRGLAVSSYAFSNDEKFVATHYYHGTIVVNDIKTGQKIKEFTDEDYEFLGVIKTEFSHDNKYIIIRNDNKLIRIYDWINEQFVSQFEY
jgi:WD40 repeat protein